MKTPRAMAVTLLTAGLILAGCASSQTDASPSASAVAPRPAPTQTSPAAAPTPSISATPEPTDAASGAYLDYTDGALETTEGAKALFFHAAWCPQCRSLDEDLRAHGAPTGLTVFKVDYDSRTDLRQKYGVTLQTTVVFVDDEGTLISSSVLYDDPSVASLAAAIP